MEIKGYHAVAVPLAPDSPFSSYLYIRQHVSKGAASAAEELPAGRTLFLANAPVREGLDTTQYLRDAFTPYGEVEDVRIKAPDAKASFRASALGYIVFRTTKGLKKAMTCSKLAAPPPAKEITEMTLLSRFRNSIVQGKALEAEVDSAMKAFEEAEAEEERRRKEVANTPDADGFVTVVYSKKRKLQGGNSNKDRRGRKKKKATYELQNFYRHQIREAKREQLAKLREKFEEDKARIERMKAARKFNPFG